MRLAGYQVRRDPVDWEKAAVWCGLVLFTAGLWALAVWSGIEIWKAIG